MRVTAGERGLRVLDAASTACCERSNPTLQVLCCALWSGEAPVQWQPPLHRQWVRLHRAVLPLAVTQHDTLQISPGVREMCFPLLRDDFQLVETYEVRWLLLQEWRCDVSSDRS